MCPLSVSHLPGPECVASVTPLQRAGEVLALFPRHGRQTPASQRCVETSWPILVSRPPTPSCPLLHCCLLSCSLPDPSLPCTHLLLCQTHRRALAHPGGPQGTVLPGYLAPRYTSRMQWTEYVPFQGYHLELGNAALSGRTLPMLGPCTGGVAGKPRRFPTPPGRKHLQTTKQQARVQGERTLWVLDGRS